jgi:hypothetical protein
MYTPKEIAVEFTDGRLRIIDANLDCNLDCNEMAVLLEFVPDNSDLPISMVSEFSEQMVKLWNERYGKR